MGIDTPWYDNYCGVVGRRVEVKSLRDVAVTRTPARGTLETWGIPHAL